LNSSRIFCHGKSIGANVAVFGTWMSRHQPKALILDSPYENIEELLEKKHKTYKKYCHWIPKPEKWNISKAISEIQVPMLFIQCN